MKGGGAHLDTVRRPHNTQPPREPTHLLVYEAQANAAQLRCCPVEDATLGTFADGFIAVIVGEVVGWWTSTRQESTPHPPRNFSFSVLKLTDHYKTRELNQVPFPDCPRCGRRIIFVPDGKPPKSASFSYELVCLGVDRLGCAVSVD